MKITWIGHSALAIAGSSNIYIDPFLTGNPKASLRLEDVTHADLVVVTHDHSDHFGDTIAICKKTGATLVALFEIAQEAEKKGIKVEKMSIGGCITVGHASVSLVPAFHSGGLGGTAVGAVIELDGKTIYHTGDTGLSLEMQLVGEMYHPDIVFLPIDGRYNMTPRLAAKAVELMRVPIAVPIHYDTWPPIASSPSEFARLVGAHARVVILKPGEAVEL